MLWAVASAIAGCFGGQTGAELAPPKQDRPNTNETGDHDGSGNSGDKQTGTSGAPSTGASLPETAAAEACDSSETALAELERELDVSLRSLEAFVAKASPFVLIRNDSSTTSASFDFSFEGGACVRRVGDAPVLSAKVVVRVRTSDLLFDVKLSGTALAFTQPAGGIGRVELATDVECAASAWGVTGSVCVDLDTEMSGYSSARLELSARLQEFGAQVQLLGVIGLFGLAQGSCQEEKCDAPKWVHLVDFSLARTE